MGFIAPYGAFCIALVSHGFQASGYAGAVYAACVATCALPFWRAFCGRPVFAFYGLVLRRYRKKQGLGAFEREEDGVAAFAEALAEHAPAFTRELVAFVQATCGNGDEDVMTTMNGASDSRQPSEKMRDAGWSAIPLHDATLGRAKQVGRQVLSEHVRRREFDRWIQREDLGARAGRREGPRAPQDG
jgi:hypothetical protein